MPRSDRIILDNSANGGFQKKTQCQFADKADGIDAYIAAPPSDQVWREMSTPPSTLGMVGSFVGLILIDDGCCHTSMKHICSNCNGTSVAVTLRSLQNNSRIEMTESNGLRRSAGWIQIVFKAAGESTFRSSL